MAARFDPYSPTGYRDPATGQVVNSSGRPVNVADIPFTNEFDPNKIDPLTGRLPVAGRGEIPGFANIWDPEPEFEIIDPTRAPTLGNVRGNIPPGYTGVPPAPVVPRPPVVSPPSSNVANPIIGPATAGVPSPIRSLIGRDLNQLSDQDLASYFNFLEDPRTAAESYLFTRGFNLANPFARRMSRTLQQSSAVADLINTIRGQPRMGPREVLSQMTNIAGRGLAGVPSTFTGAGVESVLGQLRDIVSRSGQPDVTNLTAEQRALSDIFMPEAGAPLGQSAINALLGLMGATVSPFMRERLGAALPDISRRLGIFAAPQAGGQTLLDLLLGQNRKTTPRFGG